MIEISPYSPVPIYEQLMHQLKTMIREGKLKRGESLPAIRTLALQLGVAINTVARAYQELERDGLIISNGRKGSFVREITEKGEESSRKMFRDVILQLLQQGRDKKEIEAIFHTSMNQIFNYALKPWKKVFW